jgi:hypothetical protein
MTHVCRPKHYLNMVRIFGSKMYEVTEERRRLYNKELYALYSSDIIWVVMSMRLRWTEYVPHTGKRRGAYRVLVWKPLTQ